MSKGKRILRQIAYFELSYVLVMVSFYFFIHNNPALSLFFVGIVATFLSQMPREPVDNNV